MVRYTIRLDKVAKKHLAELYKSGRKLDIKKVETFFKELEEHPEKGTGNPERLKYQLLGFWSREINKKDRLVYEIDEFDLIIKIVSAKGHYSDK